MKEIASLMNLESATTYTKKWIEYRGTALKNLMESMTTLEMQELEYLAEKWMMVGLPKEIQRK